MLQMATPEPYADGSRSGHGVNQRRSGQDVDSDVGVQL